MALDLSPGSKPVRLPNVRAGYQGQLALQVVLAGLNSTVHKMVQLSRLPIDNTRVLHKDIQERSMTKLGD